MEPKSSEQVSKRRGDGVTLRRRTIDFTHRSPRIKLRNQEQTAINQQPTRGPMKSAFDGIRSRYILPLKSKLLNEQEFAPSQNKRRSRKLSWPLISKTLRPDKEEVPTPSAHPYTKLRESSYDATGNGCISTAIPPQTPQNTDYEDPFYDRLAELTEPRSEISQQYDSMECLTRCASLSGPAEEMQHPDHVETAVKLNNRGKSRLSHVGPSREDEFRNKRDALMLSKVHDLLREAEDKRLEDLLALKAEMEKEMRELGQQNEKLTAVVDSRQSKLVEADDEIIALQDRCELLRLSNESYKLERENLRSEIQNIKALLNGSGQDLSSNAQPNNNRSSPSTLVDSGAESSQILEVVSNLEFELNLFKERLTEARSRNRSLQKRNDSFMNILISITEIAEEKTAKLKEAHEKLKESSTGVPAWPYRNLVHPPAEIPSFTEKWVAIQGELIRQLVGFRIRLQSQAENGASELLSDISYLKNAIRVVKSGIPCEELILELAELLTCVLSRNETFER